MSIFWSIIIIAACLLVEGFFSGSEIGMVSADKVKLRHDASQGSKGAKIALKMLENPEWLLSTTLVGTNLAVVTNTTIVTALMIQFFGEHGSWLAVVIAAPLIWIFGEIVPKSIFQQRADTITPYVVFFLRFASYLFFPILIVFTSLSHLFTRLIGVKGQSPFTLREEIGSMLEMPAENVDIKPREKTMIRRLFSFSETTAYEIMVPLVDVIAIEINSKCGEAVKKAVEESHTRLLVYDERVDHVVGVLNSLDLLGVKPGKKIKSYIREVSYIPKSKSIKDLLLELRKDGESVAVVVDEFGGAEGLVTMEDIMEEVVEDIEDEYDTNEQPQQWVRKLSNRDYVVSARIELDNFEEELGIKLPESKSATIAGLILEKAREIPPVGAVIEINDVKYTIKDATAQAILEIRVKW